MLNVKEIIIRISLGLILIAGMAVVEVANTDFMATNGIIDVIDRVLVPSGKYGTI